MGEDRLLSVKQVAGLLDCGVATVWRLKHNADFPKPVKFGILTRWKMNELQAFIASLQPAEKSA